MWMKACALALAELSRGISGSRAATIALVRETLIDGTGSAPVTDASIVIENGPITAARPRSSVRVPATAMIVGTVWVKSKPISSRKPGRSGTYARIGATTT
jgi:hypothetical protein